jgi:hypothetical protein
MPEEIELSKEDEAALDRAWDSMPKRRNTPEEMEKLRRRSQPVEGEGRSKRKETPEE